MTITTNIDNEKITGLSMRDIVREMKQRLAVKNRVTRLPSSSMDMIRPRRAPLLKTA